MLGRLVEPAVAGLAAQLREVPGLASGERQVVTAGVAADLEEVLWQRLHRLMLVELHAARIAGRLAAADSRARWGEWVAELAKPDGWERVAAPYPDLLPRLHRLIANRCAAGCKLARRFARDRPALAKLLAADAGELVEVSFGAGDSHHGGETVTRLRVAGGSLLYKPRAVEVDRALDEFLRQVFTGEPDRTRIRVPTVLPRADPAGAYGWAAHVAHRYCRGEGELRSFYRGLGYWLAVMRLLGGSDLHAENLIAAGPVPVVVDCETLFTPLQTAVTDGYGDALAQAVHLLSQSVLRTGLLPGRALAGWRRGDSSAAGNLPDQQPTVQVPTILDHGTDRARIGLSEPRLPERSANHPSPEPDLQRYWERVVDGFVEATGRLRSLDAAGVLAPAVARFDDLTVRVVVRDTSVYAELIQMLWHPGSLFEPEPARARAAMLLARQVRSRHGVPDDPAVVAAEVAELCDGDVPVFTTTPGYGVLDGPRGTRWGSPQDQVAAALRRWRDSDLANDQRVIRATLVGAYLNESIPAGAGYRAAPPIRTDRLERRRREQLALIVRRVSASAIRGNDGTVTWVAPLYSPSRGWTVRPTPTEVYNGHCGLAILLAGYRHEVACGRADPVPDLEVMLSAVVRTLRMAEDQRARELTEAATDELPVRPESPGGYLGLGASIWTWLLLHRLGVVTADHAHGRAEALAAQLPEAIAEDDAYDVLSGSAGAVVPLLRLAEHTGRDRWRELAWTVGERLAACAVPGDPGVYWPENGPGGQTTLGLSHGASGIGWALIRLARATGDPAAGKLAAAAFDWVDARYDPDGQGWQDARGVEDRTPPTWCHGAPGIGVCAADLAGSGAAVEAGERWRDLLARAADSVGPDLPGRDLTLCHGDLGCWELLDRAERLRLAPPGVDREAMVARIVGTVEADGPVPGPYKEVFQPGLMVGSGGVAYQLLRMHPDCDLPSALLPDPGPPQPLADLAPM